MDRVTRSQVFGLLSRTRDALQARDVRSPMRISSTDARAIAMYSRCRSLFSAIRILVERRLSHEALALGRLLFEEYLRLAQLQVAGNGMAGMILRAEETLLAREEDLMRLAAEAGLDDDPTTTRQLLRERADKIAGYRARNEIPGGESFESVDAAARGLGLKKELWAYEFAGLAADGLLGSRGRTRRMAEEATAFVSEDQDDDVAMQATWFACRAALLATEAVSRILDLQTPPIVQRLIDEVESFGHRGSDYLLEGPIGKERKERRPSIRFFIGSDSHESVRWKAIQHGSDIYITGQRLPWWKVSLHRDGTFLISFDKNQLHTLPSVVQERVETSKGGRCILRWDPKPLGDKGTRLLLRLLIPSTVVARSRVDAKQPAHRIPDYGPGTATEVAIIQADRRLRTCPACTSMGLMALGLFDLPRGDTVWVAWRQGPAAELMPPGGSQRVSTSTADFQGPGDPYALVFGTDAHDSAFIAEYRVELDVKGASSGKANEA